MARVMESMILQLGKDRSVRVLEEALARLLGLSHLYQRQLSVVRNYRLRQTLEGLLEEKRRHAQTLEKVIGRYGGDTVHVRIPMDHPVNSERELISWIYREEENMVLWYQEQITATQDEEVRALLQSLLSEEDRHLQIVKDLYRDITYC